jgi:hypothetical protein
VRLVPGPLQAELPLPLDGVALFLQVPQRRQGRLQTRRPHRIEECRNDRRVDLPGQERLAPSEREVRLGAPALVARPLATVADAHLLAAPAATDQPLQERRPFPRRAAALGLEVVPVAVELAAVGQEGVVADVAGVDALDHDRPLLRRQAPLGDSGRVAGRDLLAASPVDERARVGGVDQHAMDHAVGGPDPGDPPHLGAGLDQAREGQVVSG